MAVQLSDTRTLSTSKENVNIAVPSPSALLPIAPQIPIANVTAGIFANAANGQRTTCTTNANATVTSGALNDGRSCTFNVHVNGHSSTFGSAGLQRRNNAAAVGINHSSGNVASLPGYAAAVGANHAKTSSSNTNDNTSVSKVPPANLNSTYTRFYPLI